MYVSLTHETRAQLDTHPLLHLERHHRAILRSELCKGASGSAAPFYSASSLHWSTRRSERSPHAIVQFLVNTAAVAAIGRILEPVWKWRKMCRVLARPTDAFPCAMTCFARFAALAFFFASRARRGSPTCVVCVGCRGGLCFLQHLREQIRLNKAKTMTPSPEPKATEKK